MVYEKVLPDSINKVEIENYFGDWCRNPEKLESEFQSALPYSHVVIDNFFNEKVAQECMNVFPDKTDSCWSKYNNPIERKLACNNIKLIPSAIQDILYVLNTQEFVEKVMKITGIQNLEIDPYLHGGGIHSHPDEGHLDMHLDYSIHPVSKKERRLNLIIYLNQEWEEIYGGDLQMWDKNMKKCIKSIYPKYNRAILFQTSDLSYHGIPNGIHCPKHLSRNSIAVYYVSEPRLNVMHRPKAKYVGLPNEKNAEALNKLRKIREKRLVTKEDIENIGLTQNEWP